MRANRLEAFSDGVLAIVITIMVLELKAPDRLTVDELLHDLPVLMSYLLSFVMVAVVWVSAATAPIARLHRRAHIRNAIGVLAYLASMPLAYVSTKISYAIFVAVALMYFLPDTDADTDAYSTPRSRS